MRIHSNSFEITFGLQDDLKILYFNSFSPYEGHDSQIWFELKIFSFSLSYHFCIVVLVTIVCVWMQVRIVFQRDLGPPAEREAAGEYTVRMVGWRFIFTLAHQHSLYSLALGIWFVDFIFLSHWDVSNIGRGNKSRNHYCIKVRFSFRCRNWSPSLPSEQKYIALIEHFEKNIAKR